MKKLLPDHHLLSHDGEMNPQNLRYEFTFDKMDVMLSQNDIAPGSTGLRKFTYDPLHPDRLSGLTPDGGAAFAVNYDGNGNLLNLPGQQFEYNAKNELTRFTNSASLIAEYRYDHLGFRISKILTDAQGNVTRILCVGDQAEVRNGTPAYFVRIGPFRVAVLTGGTTLFIHENGLGSTSFVTNSIGQRVGTIDYHPFGNVTKRSGSVDFPTFSLHPVDAESGLVYMRRRYYSPPGGPFLDARSDGDLSAGEVFARAARFAFVCLRRQ